MSKFVSGDIVRLVLPSGAKVGEPMIVKGYIPGRDRVVVVGCITNKAFAYFPSSIDKEPTRKLIVKKKEFEVLKKVQGVGSFYHELSKTFEEVVDIQPTYVTFKYPGGNERLVYHLAKAEKVIKTIGIAHNGNYQPQRIGCPMVKLTFIGKLL